MGQWWNDNWQKTAVFGERVAPVVLQCTWVSLGEKLVTDYLSYGMDHAIM